MRPWFTHPFIKTLSFKTIRALRPARCLCNWISRLEHDDVELNRRESDSPLPAKSGEREKRSIAAAAST
jgi:hypothetical protein